MWQFHLHQVSSLISKYPSLLLISGHTQKAESRDGLLRSGYFTAYVLQCIESSITCPIRCPLVFRSGYYSKAAKINFWFSRKPQTTLNLSDKGNTFRPSLLKEDHNLKTKIKTKGFVITSYSCHQTVK